jgi:hypothetical protein
MLKPKKSKELLRRLLPQELLRMRDRRISSSKCKLLLRKKPRRKPERRPRLNKLLRLRLQDLKLSKPNLTPWD